uniref:Uncharacterized protein n=1 Tax=Glossina austeni TaxID=7395 RepID=A0A1A9VXN8_GLOAU
MENEKIVLSLHEQFHTEFCSWSLLFKFILDNRAIVDVNIIKSHHHSKQCRRGWLPVKKNIKFFGHTLYYHISTPFNLIEIIYEVIRPSQPPPPHRYAVRERNIPETMSQLMGLKCRYKAGKHRKNL